MFFFQNDIPSCKKQQSKYEHKKAAPESTAAAADTNTVRCCFRKEVKEKSIKAQGKTNNRCNQKIREIKQTSITQIFRFSNVASMCYKKEPKQKELKPGPKKQKLKTEPKKQKT